MKALLALFLLMALPLTAKDELLVATPLSIKHSQLLAMAKPQVAKTLIKGSVAGFSQSLF